ncbi:MAG TPA: hypothetical protein VNP92_01635 [Actinophytocola sp.]|nr:hypothetical protein [Actinophytocola sp.]
MSTHFQSTISHLPAWLRSADDTAAPVAEGAREKDLRPVFADPSGRRRVLVRGTAATIAAAGVAFMAGAGLLLSNPPLPAAPYNIGAPPAAGEQHAQTHAGAGDPAAGLANMLPGAVLTPGQGVSSPDADASGATPAAARQPDARPGVPSNRGSTGVVVGVPADTTPGSPADPTSPPAADPPPVAPPPASPPTVVPPVAPPAETPGLIETVTEPVTTVVGSLLDALL